MKSVLNNANASLFVDDFVVYIEGKHLKHLECTMHKQNSNMGRRKRFQIFYFENHMCPFSQATYI